MRISHSSYQKYIENLSNEIEGKLLFSPILINNETLLFPFAENYNNSLVISLNNRCPLIYKINCDIFFKSFENSFFQKFKKIFNRTIITNLTLSDKDNIVLPMSARTLERKKHQAAFSIQIAISQFTTIACRSD